MMSWVQISEEQKEVIRTSDVIGDLDCEVWLWTILLRRFPHNYFQDGMLIRRCLHLPTLQMKFENFLCHKATVGRRDAAPKASAGFRDSNLGPTTFGGWFSPSALLSIL